MSKSRAKRYYMDEDYEYNSENKNRQRFEDRRKTKRMKQAIKTRNLEYFEEEKDDA